MNLLARKFPTILGILMLAGAVAYGVWWISQNKPKVDATLMPSKVRITNVADSKFSVSWITTQSTQGKIEYGKIGEKITEQAADERGEVSSKTHQVTVEGLQPNTQYSFRIVSGSGQARFDNNGSPYAVQTGPVIGETPPAKSFYGTIRPGTGASAEGAIVYLSLPGSAPVSTLVKAGGSYTLSLSTIRATDLKSYATYDPSATIATVTVEGAGEESTVTVSTANSAPVPLITLGQNADYRTAEVAPQIAELDNPVSSPTPTASAVTPAIFNVEPLAGSVNEIQDSSLKIINPSVEGEVLSTLRPEFRGTGPANITLTIAVSGQKAVSDTVLTDLDGTWSWAPVVDLKAGKQTLIVSYKDSSNKEQKVSRVFNINTTVVTPAFESTPSASVKTSAAPIASKTPTPTPSPRDTLPATDSGVPVTGVITPTLLTAGASIVMMVIGAFLLAL